MLVIYSSNNSGGGWWLDDEDWRKLEAAGWKVEWVKDDPYFTKYTDGDDRWLGALARGASLECGSMDEAVASFETATGQYADEIGCDCCGPPHHFYDDDDE